MGGKPACRSGHEPCCRAARVPLPRAGVLAEATAFLINVISGETTMEPNQFDEFAKALATTTSRRQVLKAFAASAAGGLLALSGVGEVAAKCKDNGHQCAKNEHCCS